MEGLHNVHRYSLENCVRQISDRLEYVYVTDIWDKLNTSPTGPSKSISKYSTGIKDNGRSSGPHSIVDLDCALLDRENVVA